PEPGAPVEYARAEGAQRGLEGVEAVGGCPDVAGVGTHPAGTRPGCWASCGHRDATTPLVGCKQRPRALTGQALFNAPLTENRRVRVNRLPRGLRGRLASGCVPRGSGGASDAAEGRR